MTAPVPDKLNVLWYSDSPTVTTGFGLVARNLLRELHASGRFDFTVLGINHSDWYDRDVFPYRIFEAMPITSVQNGQYHDAFGRRRLLDFLQSGKFDVLFTLQDTFVMSEIAQSIQAIRNSLPPEKRFVWIFYFPIDAPPKEEWIANVVGAADVPVTYTEYARRETVRRDPSVAERLRVIYHGTDLEVFRPLDPAERRKIRAELFGGVGAADKFIVTNVNRNQPRKDIDRTFRVFAELHKQRPESFLFLHMKHEDVGGRLVEMARNYDLKPGTHYAFTAPDTFSERFGIPVAAVNRIYNASDALLTTSLGEGWGLSVTEAMAAGLPVVAPDHTSLAEIGAEGRALLCRAGSTSSEWIGLGASDNERVRPLCNVEHAVEQLCLLHDDRESGAEMTRKARDWVQRFAWSAVAADWLDAFEQARRVLTELRVAPLARHAPFEPGQPGSTGPLTGERPLRGVPLGGGGPHSEE